MVQATIVNGDCLDVLRTMPDASIDSIVTDPPYGLGFMGKKWDIGIPAVDIFAECLRVLKPGGHLLAFGGSRTYHRLAVAVEDAGFDIRDQIMWVYGSGFPKSRNIGREVEGMEGWGTALKPAHEPIVVARKPIKGTVAANVMAHGTGALNIDGCRVEGEPWRAHSTTGLASTKFFSDGDAPVIEKSPHELGRFPANLIHDGSEEVTGLFPANAGASAPAKGTEASKAGSGQVTGQRERVAGAFHSDKGSAARFFYCAKASKSDRNLGLEELDDKASGFSNGAQIHGEGYNKGQGIGLNRVVVRKNHHPTVKPVSLMRYLVRLVTPPGGVVLDPFTGSGSTGKAAVLEGASFIGIEREAEYMPIIEGRVAHALDSYWETAA